MANEERVAHNRGAVAKGITMSTYAASLAIKCRESYVRTGQEGQVVCQAHSTQALLDTWQVHKFLPRNRLPSQTCNLPCALPTFCLPSSMLPLMHLGLVPNMLQLSPHNNTSNNWFQAPTMLQVWLWQCLMTSINLLLVVCKLCVHNLPPKLSRYWNLTIISKKG